MIEIIDTNFKIATILSPSRKIINIILNQFKDKNILVWQYDNLDCPCKKILINFETNLLKLLKTQLNEFNFLIVSGINKNTPSKKTITFIKRISKMKQMQNKQVIFLFNCNSIDECKNNSLINKVNLKYSEKIYTLKPDNHHYFFTELKTGLTSVFRNFN